MSGTNVSSERKALLSPMMSEREIDAGMAQGKTKVIELIKRRTSKKELFVNGTTV